MKTAILLLVSLTGATPPLPNDRAPVPSDGAPLARSERASQDTVTRIVRGRVLSEPSGDPLPLATVESGAGSTYRVATTDGQGRYVLYRVPAGRQLLRVSTLDHAPLEVSVEVPETGDLELDLLLQLTPIGLGGITVVATPLPANRLGSDGPDPGRGSPADPELRALEATPGVAELGLVDGARAEPGTDPRDPESALYVRGAASDMKLVLLDGAPVYAPFHLGGLLEAFQPHVLRSAWLYSGGAPVRYDGGLSYILDLGTRAGRNDGIHSAGAIDMLGASALVEGPMGPAAFLAGARVMHRAGSESLIGDRLPYGYVDGLARLDLDVPGGGHLGATGFFNRESVELDRVTALDEPAHWGNSAGSLRYDGHIAGSAAELTAALSRFSTRLPVGVEAAGVADGNTTRARLAADLSRPLGALHLGYGASYDRQSIQYQAWEASDTGTVWLFRQGTSEALGGYAELVVEPADDLRLRGGLRANLFLSTSTARLAPRLALTWRVSEHSELSLAGGRYYQYLRAPETILSGSLSDVWGETAIGRDATPVLPRTLAVAGASHLTLGLDHRPRDDLRLGVAAFYKSFDGTPEVEGLRASGVDVWLDWSAGGWAAWAGYSLAWAWAADELAYTTDRFSARQLLSGGVGAPLPSGLRFDVRVASSSGQPFTAIPTGDGTLGPRGQVELTNDQVTEAVQADLAGAPGGSYLRLDAMLSRSWTVRMLGSDVELIPYLKLLNALDRRDAIFYQFEAGQDLRPRSLQAVPLLPVIGLEWRN